MAISFTACSIPAVITGPHCREDTVVVTLAALRVEFKVWMLLRTGNLSMWGWGHVPVWGLEPSQLLPPLCTASTWEAACGALMLKDMGKLTDEERSAEVTYTHGCLQGLPSCQDLTGSSKGWPGI